MWINKTITTSLIILTTLLWPSLTAFAYDQCGTTYSNTCIDDISELGDALSYICGDNPPIDEITVWNTSNCEVSGINWGGDKWDYNCGTTVSSEDPGVGCWVVQFHHSGYEDTWLFWEITEPEPTPTPTPTPTFNNTATASYESLTITDSTVYHGTILLFLGFIFPVWYFNKKRNDRLFSIYGEVKHNELR